LSSDNPTFAPGAQEEPFTRTLGLTTPTEYQTPMSLLARPKSRSLSVDRSTWGKAGASAMSFTALHEFVAEQEDELTVKPGIGAFSAAAKPTITINGSNAPVDAEGIGEFKTRAEGSGEHTVNVHIVFTKPDGSQATKDVPVKYTVGVPSGASIFLEKMNVVYVAEENPITISGGSVGAEKVHVSFTNGDIHKISGDSWVCIPDKPGDGTITVTANGKPTPFPMRVKYLPDPVGFVGTHTGGIVSTAEFKADGGVIAKLQNSDFISGFTVIDYKLAATINGQYLEVTNQGRAWTGQAAQLVDRCTPGTHVFIDELRCKGKDNRVRTLPSMIFTLK